MTRKLLPLVVLVLALVGGIAWWAVRDARVHGLERAEKNDFGLKSEPQAQLATESQPLEARSAEKGDANAAGGAALGGGGTGTLRLHVLDEATRAPIPELGFVVYRERGGEKELARGKTDKDGRAELPGIESNTILVFTERKPPHARKTGALWLAAGATRELEVLVGEGGAVEGRVVDDLGEPVADAELRVNDNQLGIRGFGTLLREAQARSGKDGRFRIENLSSPPGAVWIVDGEMRPQSWGQVDFSAWRDNVWVSSKAMPIAGKTVDVGDLVLKRATTYSGTVLDPANHPVAAALVSLGGNRKFARTQSTSMRPEWSIGPADPGFKLLRGEVLTDAAGRFELRAGERQIRVDVWTRADELQEFQLPAGEVGERVDRIVLKLDLTTRLELELVDSAGAPARVPARVIERDSLFTNWRWDVGDSPEVRVDARLRDGNRIGASAAKRDADGKWRIALRADSSRIDELSVSAPGYVPIVEDSVTGFTPLVCRRLELVEYPAFHVRLLPKDPAAPLLEAPGVEAQIHVCMANPARHALAPGCCGFGVRWNGNWRGDSLALTLPVRRKGSYWIYAIRYFGKEKYEDFASFGPFEPSAEEHELVLDPADFDGREKALPGDPPPARAPGDPQFVKLSARILDARTHAPIPGALLECADLVPTTDRSWGHLAAADRNGEIRELPMYPRRCAFSASASSYKRAELGERKAHAGDTIEFGTILLEPAPVHRGRLLGVDGEPPVGDGLFSVLTEEGAPDRNLRVDLHDDGRFVLTGELPSRPLLQVCIQVLGLRGAFEYQRFRVESWPEDEVLEFHLAQSRRVFVTVLGVDPEETELIPCACIAPGEPLSTCDHRQSLLAGHTPLASGCALDSAQAGGRYQLQLAPGRYQVWGLNALHELPVTDLEVTPGATDLELTITAH
jgi:hypothetical protein